MARELLPSFLTPSLLIGKMVRALKQHILIVDDVAELAYAFQRYFEYHGFRVSVADSAQSALIVCASDPIDGIITDFRMHGMNGEKLLASVREKQPDLPGIILSAYTYEIGAADQNTRVISKPVDPPVLVKAMRDMLPILSS